eukprot:2925020-Prymnesium_polylepis.2
MLPVPRGGFEEMPYDSHSVVFYSADEEVVLLPLTTVPRAGSFSIYEIFRDAPVRMRLLGLRGSTAIVGDFDELVRLTAEGQETNISRDDWDHDVSLTLVGPGSAELWFSRSDGSGTTYRLQVHACRYGEMAFVETPGAPIGICVACESVPRDSHRGLDAAAYTKAPLPPKRVSIPHTSQVCSAYVAEQQAAREHATRTTILVIIPILGTIVLFISLLGVRRLRNFYVEAEENQILLIDAEREKIYDAVSAVTTMRFSVCFVRFDELQKLGQFTSHEECRSRGILTTLDTYDQLIAFATKNATVFCSHQWLGWSEPDPDGVHYPAIIDACQALCERQKLKPDDLFVWIGASSTGASQARARTHARIVGITVQGGPRDARLTTLFSGAICAWHRLQLDPTGQRLHQAGVHRQPCRVLFYLPLLHLRGAGDHSRGFEAGYQ